MTGIFWERKREVKIFAYSYGKSIPFLIPKSPTCKHLTTTVIQHTINKFNYLDIAFRALVAKLEVFKLPETLIEKARL
jgi:hypothetical protein